MNNEGGKSTEMRSILLVHGRDFKPDAVSLFDLSIAALRAAIDRDYPDSVHIFDGIACDIAYYGDLTNELLSRHGKIYDAPLDLGDRSNALAELRNISSRKRFGIRQYDSLPGKSAVPEFVANFAAPLAGTVGLTIPLIAQISSDFAEYLRGDNDYVEAVRERVRKKLCAMLKRDDCVMLMSHGTGAVVAYDVLWQLSHDPRFKEEYQGCKLDTWVTLGAPLGDSNVRKRLLGAKEKNETRCPTNVITWHNVSAEDDFTCHDGTLADDFKEMLRQRVISVVRDYHAYNLAIRYGKSNPHSSIGYFIHPRTAKIVVDWMQSEVPQESPKYIL